jgi:hypothetical protein
LCELRSRALDDSGGSRTRKRIHGCSLNGWHGKCKKTNTKRIKKCSLKRSTSGRHFNSYMES